MAIQEVRSSLSEREQLKERVIPHMIFADPGSQNLLQDSSAPSRSVVSNVNATKRFSVCGNAIVTGGTGTLGREACTALLEHGLTNLAIFDLNTNELSREIGELRSSFPNSRILLYSVDVTCENSIKAVVDEVVQEFGAVHHLLCFSGIVGCVDALEMPTKDWRRILDVNTTGAFLCAQTVARKMVEQTSGGSIVFVASISAHRVNYPQPQAAYNVSKAALITLKNCLAAEWARYGIRTNTISPGYMDTILNEGPALANARRIWTERNPSGRMGRPQELNGAVVMLSSESSTYINGCDIVVDGGGLVL